MWVKEKNKSERASIMQVFSSIFFAFIFPLLMEILYEKGFFFQMKILCKIANSIVFYVFPKTVGSPSTNISIFL